MDQDQEYKAGSDSQEYSAFTGERNDLGSALRSEFREDISHILLRPKTR